MDVDERRRKIAEAVMRVIAQEGLHAVTVRRISAELGFSTTFVTYNFADKQELLLGAYRTLGEMALSRFDRFTAHDPEDLVEMLLSMTAVNETYLAAWRTYVAIWDRSLHDQNFAMELNSWTEIILDLLTKQIQGLNPACANATKIGRRLLALIQGISVQILFNRNSWSPQEARDTIANELSFLLRDGSGSVTGVIGVTELIPFQGQNPASAAASSNTSR